MESVSWSHTQIEAAPGNKKPSSSARVFTRGGGGYQLHQMRRRCSHSDPLDTYDRFHTTVLDLAECFCKVDVGWELMHFGGRQFSSSFPILFPAGRRFSFSCPCCCCSLRGEPVVVPFVLFVLLTLPIPQLVTLILDDFLVRGVSADDAVDLELTLVWTLRATSFL